MTTLTPTPSAPTPPPALPGTPPPQPTGPAPLRLIRAELLKIWTTNAWWIFAILMVGATGLALLINILQADAELANAEQLRREPPDFGEGLPPGEGPTPADIERQRQEIAAASDIGRILVRSAANIYTSGQFFGLLFMVVLGALIMTNEFFHQTATTTFLTTPRRSQVILSKLAAAALTATAFWVIITAIDLAIGSLYFASTSYDTPSLAGPVGRSVVMNLLAFVIWTVLGVALGVLIRSQLGATLTGAAFYLLSFPVAFIFFGLVRAFIIKQDWVWQWIAAVPGVASQIMISPERMQIGYSETGPIYGPAWWVGGLVLLGYGVVASVIGTLITRTRDIS